ncbi:MAG: carboxypeptidase-like regulatory domain-containing protein [Winogradskyella sp.]|uniref:carboxypeptidase-like regulatory domain-containing protein n=1 Tax=Winogradskyella sp. TaxID=1883156 RepID=UPI00183AF5A0|nr:carboxypeptidase-like regulatory domain-containing protein [Winogradskyella sp.]MBT8243722.1 carboxypeptidase-like regulatory domain-containing protein [Winogradskyella sp.]NNK22084.1 carboxypeptidase-like regulatory domain-containing protein [Winogradskyella sp.]
MLYNRFKFYLSLSFLLLTYIGFSQVEITGKVIDSVYSEPIENASIYVKNTTIGTISNTDGRFALTVPLANKKDTLIISSIGFKSFRIAVEEFQNNQDVFLYEDVASLDEIVILANPRPTTGNAIVLKAIEELSENLPDSAYLQKGFLRHKERNKLEFKWLIESAITVYDSGYGAKSTEHLKINVDEMRKSYDLRNVDSIFSYVSYRNRISKRNRLRAQDIRRQDVSKQQLVNAIKWNDTRVNGLQNLFQGKLSLLRNVQDTKSLFGEDILKRHQFALDTILVDDGRKIYKIKIDESSDFVGLDTKGMYNEGYKAQGWLYIYYDNYAIKRVEYDLVAASDKQKSRSKRLFGTQTNHKLVINYIEYNNKMYPNYIYYETPKLVNVGLKTDKKVTQKEIDRYNREERYYYTVQEILFTEIIQDRDIVQSELNTKPWNMDIFMSKPYNKEFWRNYNILLESEEDEEMIDDLSKRASLFKD